MHYTEEILIHQMAKQHHLDKDMIKSLLKESKNNSYRNVKDSKRVAEIETIISFYMKKDETS